MFYVYAYLRDKNSMISTVGTPYYIGKGKDDRAWSKDHLVKIPDNAENIIILESGLTEVGALAIERRMIKWYGRVDNNSGILRNRTDGGDGSAGAFFSEETKRKMRKPKPEGHGENVSKALKGKPKSPEHRKALSDAGKGNIPWNKGKKGIYSEEHRTKISEYRKKHFMDHPEAREKMRQINLGKGLTEEHKKKISGSTIGIPKSDETKKRMSLSMTGKKRKPFSEEHKKKMSEARKLYLERRRNGAN